jgi:ubiquinone/menaquinone biosynthesis C-methylase UbiE
MPRPGNYAEQAKTYDLTRGASPTVVRAVARYLGPAQGRSLLDIAQAFEARGFRVTVLDASPDMLAHAARKLGPGRSVACDAQALPFREGRFDGATMINAIHLLEDPSQALREARRILRGGPLVLTAFTRENMALFVFDYFDLEAPAYFYTDTVDGSLNALHTNALHLAGPAYLRNTSFWHALDEETRRKGLDALARDLRSGVLERKVEDSVRTAVPSGHGTAFAAWPSV